MIISKILTCCGRELPKGNILGVSRITRYWNSAVIMNPYWQPIDKSFKIDNPIIKFY